MGITPDENRSTLESFPYKIVSSVVNIEVLGNRSMKSVWAFIVAAKRSSAKMIVIFFIIRKIYSYKNWLISYFINRFHVRSAMLAN
jgi:hypothetical protein